MFLNTDKKMCLYHWNVDYKTPQRLLRRYNTREITEEASATWTSATTRVSPTSSCMLRKWTNGNNWLIQSRIIRVLSRHSVTSLWQVGKIGSGDECVPYFMLRGPKEVFKIFYQLFVYQVWFDNIGNGCFKPNFVLPAST